MEDKLCAFLDSQVDAQLRLLERMVLQSSHTFDKEGVDAVGRMLMEALEPCGLNVTINRQQEYGDNILFSTPCCTEASPHILLLGHMDTVFPQGSSFNFFREDEVKAYGPGIIDMKGGLVTAVYALRALHSVNLLKDIPIILLCNSDEEKGSPQSTEVIRQTAIGSLCGLVFECGGTGGEVATGRKGKIGYILEVAGKAGHAAFTGKNTKASAILELAQKIIKLEQLNDPGREIVVNVGQIQGGTGANVVAAHARADIDTRFVTQRDGESVRAWIEDITRSCSVPETQGTLTLTNTRHPMEQTAENNELFEVIQGVAEKLGLPVKAELRSGVSDANTLAELGVPVIDGLGPIGDLDHSENEYMIKKSLSERCKLAALSILALHQKYRNG